LRFFGSALRIVGKALDKPNSTQQTACQTHAAGANLLHHHPIGIHITAVMPQAIDVSPGMHREKTAENPFMHFNSDTPGSSNGHHRAIGV